MSMTLQEIRDELRRAAGVNSTTHPDSIIDPFIQRSYWELQDKVDFREKEAKLDFSLVVGTNVYSTTTLASDFDNIIHLSILPQDSTAWVELDRKDFTYITDNRDDDTDARAQPEYYARFGSSIYFIPTPDYAYSVTMVYRKVLGDVGTSGPSIPTVWHEFVFLGALQRLYYTLGEFNRASAVRNERDSLIITTPTTSTKERMDSSRAGISILRQRY
jgi:hypothetical protein